MNNIENIYRVVFITIGMAIIWLILIYIKNKSKEKKFAINIVKNNIIEYKNKGISFLNNINYIKKYVYSINEIKENKMINKYNSILNGTLMIALSIITFIIIYIIVFFFTGVYSLAFLSAFPALFLSNFIIKYILNNHKEKIIRALPGYIINLRNYVEIDNNIVAALDKVTCPNILSIYINRFNIAVKKGTNVILAFENMKKQINIKMVSEILTLLQSCYIYGGNYKTFLERYEKNINKIILEREKVSQELFSSNIVLAFMICINIYILITYIFLNNEYKTVMIGSFVGVVILNANILSFYLISYIIYKIKKLEV